MANYDQELKIADVYAAALFELASESDTVASARLELDELVKLMRVEPEFAKFMVSRVLEGDARATALERMFRGKLSDIVLNTLLVMNEHDRCGLLRALHRRFVLRQEEAAHEIEVTVTTAVELSKHERAEAERLASEISRLRPLVEYVVDPDILGGMILQVGDLRLDNSVSRHLHDVGARLVERADRGLELATVED